MCFSLARTLLPWRRSPGAAFRGRGPVGYFRQGPVSATAAQRSPARAPAAKDAAKPVNEKPVSTQEQPRAARTTAPSSAWPPAGLKTASRVMRPTLPPSSTTARTCVCCRWRATAQPATSSICCTSTTWTSPSPTRTCSTTSRPPRRSPTSSSASTTSSRCSRARFTCWCGRRSRRSRIWLARRSASIRTAAAPTTPAPSFSSAWAWRSRRWP